MDTYARTRFDGFLGIVTASLGILIFGYGLLLVPASVLGGLWIAAIGAALLCAVVVGSGWARRRLGLSPDGGGSQAAGFLTVAVVLAVAFVVVNGMTFTQGSQMGRL